jgi:DnaJ family protein C protein 13
MQYALDTVIRLAVSSPLQEALINAGVLYRLLPLLFRYDATLDMADAAPNAAATGASAAANKPSPSPNSLTPAQAAQQAGHSVDNNEQKAANMQAKQAIRALGRLGGYLDGDLATPVNPRVRRSMAALLTPPLAKRLARASPEALLRTLNSHEESALVVWTHPMRKELMTFVAQQVRAV